MKILLLFNILSLNIYAESIFLKKGTKIVCPSDQKVIGIINQNIKKVPSFLTTDFINNVVDFTVDFVKAKPNMPFSSLCYSIYPLGFHTENGFIPLEKGKESLVKGNINQVEPNYSLKDCLEIEKSSKRKECVKLISSKEHSYYCGDNKLPLHLLQKEFKVSEFIWKYCIKS